MSEPPGSQGWSGDVAAACATRQFDASGGKIRKTIRFWRVIQRGGSRGGSETRPYAGARLFDVLSAAGKRLETRIDVVRCFVEAMQQAENDGAWQCFSFCGGPAVTQGAE